ncbi:uncharacterized protein ColSpa_04465 [Colletotrichum spaethianum]|uniref:Uncharacterized protein n=1 Tax=Colletotrichum spaethianum TaxID=700344 RepID=A0AA37P7J8_9PEZI|nr:uncharacterized protein ColSpa_04465 [Colletotrichum spaethianum]GKT44284.1 hypothetical protein ColSpa_04465 [Colletotrichum spaethianum]
MAGHVPRRRKDGITQRYKATPRKLDLIEADDDTNANAPEGYCTGLGWAAAERMHKKGGGGG